VRVSPKGKRTFFITYYAEGKTKRFTLGVFPKFSLADAKTKANEYSESDPVAEKKAAKEEQERLKIEAKEKYKAKELEKMSLRTMEDLWKEYSSLERYTDKATSTKCEELRKWKTNIKPILGGIPVKDITPVMVNTLIKDLARKSPVSANRLFSFLKVLFSPALEDGWIDIHPMQHLRKQKKEKPRKVFLSDDEIKKVWPVLDKLADNPRDILRLILLTAQRPGEVSAMKWKDIDFENRLWTQAKNKTDTLHLVPLSLQVIEILFAREMRGKWVFPSSYNKAKGARSGHSKCTKNAREKVHKWSGVEGFTAHDLRRSARTLMSRLQIKHHVRERVLNHSQGGIVGVYDQHDYLQEKADALNKLGREIYQIVGLDVEETTVIPVGLRI
jgi:integrase